MISPERGKNMSEWRLKVLYDGSCPICASEMRSLNRLDHRGRLVFEDITSPEFDAARYGKTEEQLMGAIHGVFPDGSILTGVEVFRRAYAAVGLGWLLAPTGWPVLRPLFDSLYRLFAGNRKRIGSMIGRDCPEGRCPVH
jgi:predicted DCC family thiol-disulfide oxidoreductase YuxK